MKKSQMNPVVHFEMPADDLARTKKFYEEAFGWQLNQLGKDMGNYLLAGTQEMDKEFMPLKPGAINGGFYPRQEGSGTHVVISVDDLEAHMKRVVDVGGKIEGEPMDIPGIGRFVMFHDTEGNRVGMLQPVPMEKK